MYPTVRSRLTYANVMSTIAVFLALGGGAVAAGGDNGGGDKGSQHQADDSGGNGGGDQGGKDRGGKGHGDKGGNSDNGGNAGGNEVGGNDSTDSNATATGSLGFTTREGDTVSTDSKTSEAITTALCEDNETLVGGGVRTTSGKDRIRGQAVEGNPVVQSSGPDGNGWSANVLNDGSVGGVKATAYAICASTK
jgi:hypothetical protein